MVEITQAEIKLDAGEYTKVLAALDRASKNVGRHPHVLDLMYKAHLGMGEEKVSAAYFREGLLLSESALPELPMPDKAISRSVRLANLTGAGLGYVCRCVA